IEIAFADVEPLLLAVANHVKLAHDSVEPIHRAVKIKWLSRVIDFVWRATVRDLVMVVNAITVAKANHVADAKQDERLDGVAVLNCRIQRSIQIARLLCRRGIEAINELLVERLKPLSWKKPILGRRGQRE